MITRSTEEELTIPCGDVNLNGSLTIPDDAPGIVIFAHGSGSSRFSSRNRYVARILNEAGMGTLLFDLLTKSEEISDEYTGHYRFNIQLLAERLSGVTAWVASQRSYQHMKIGYFGASTGAAAALVAAARNSERVDAIVSRGGRPDLAGDELAKVRAPTLFLVGGFDTDVLKLNEQAMASMNHAETKLVVIPGASHLFEEPGKLAEVATYASLWFRSHLGASLRGDMSA